MIKFSFLLRLLKVIWNIKILVECDSEECGPVMRAAIWSYKKNILLFIPCKFRTHFSCVGIGSLTVESLMNEEATDLYSIHYSMSNLQMTGR